jgi:hypothetical protein
MNGLSDLDMVAQAMATTTRLPQDQTDAPRAHATASDVPNDLDLPTTTSVDSDSSIPEDIAHDLETLSMEDKQALGPLLDLLVSQEGTAGQDLEDLLKQFDAADDVADKLEGRLDQLLQGLKGVEGELEVTDGGEDGTDRPGEMASEAKAAFKETSPDQAR